MTEGALKLCATSEVPQDQSLRVDLPGRDPLAVCRLNGNWFVLADTCTHGMASLSEGEIMGGRIYCPFHGGSFDIRTGAVADPPCTVDVETFPCFEKDDHVYLDLGTP
jgi:nitrite reductase/ring-hydroxylating ferredoxin subunit